MEGRTPVPDSQHIADYAAHHATMVIFLSASLVRKLQEQLLSGGYDKDTKAAIVYKASWPDEKPSFVLSGRWQKRRKKTPLPIRH